MTAIADRVVAFKRWLDGSDGDTTEEVRSGDALRRRRDRRAAASTVAAAGARTLAIAASFLSIPLAIGFLGAERYGILVAVTSLTGMLVFADLGLGNGLLNTASDARARGDREAVASATSSAFFMLLVVAGAAIMVFTATYPVMDWPAFFNVRTEPAVAESGPAVAVAVVVFLLAIPLGLVERLRLAHQEGFVNSAAASLGSVLGLACLVAAILMQASLPVLLAAMVLPPVVTLLANGLILLRHRPWLTPKLSRARRAVALRLARIGSLFLVLQVAIAVAFQSDVIVAAAVLGPEAAATYAVTLKFFLIAPSFIGFYLAALWPAYSEAIARGDTAWIRSTLRRSMLIAATGSTAFAAAMLAIGPWLLPAWTGGEVRPPFPLLLGAAAWSVLLATFSSIAMLFNAASVVLFQVVTATVMAAVSIVASILLANAIGLPGIVLGTVGAYVVFSAIPIAIYLPRLLKRLDTLSPHEAHA